jgi:hypothetical protein
MDPSGTALWVGGLNYIEEISLSTYTPTVMFTVSGQVTSLGISQGESAIVYSTVSSASGAYQSQNAAIATGATVATYENIGIVSTDYTAAYAVSKKSSLVNSAGQLPLYLVSTGAMVSSYYGNRYAVVATPVGFDLYDLQTNTVMFSTATSGPVRGVAIDPLYSTAYLTIADSNTVLEVPLPPPQPQSPQRLAAKICDGADGGTMRGANRSPLVLPERTESRLLGWGSGCRPPEIFLVIGCSTAVPYYPVS